MLFHVRMDVNIPLDMPAETANEIKAVENSIFAGITASR